MKSIRFNQTMVAAALAFATLSAQAAIALPPAFTALYVFGDSLSDSGNNYLQFGNVTGPAPINATFVPTYPYAPSFPVPGTLPDYSNGPSWVTPFAAGLGLGAFALPSLMGGGNYAYGGARMVIDGVAPPPLPVNFPPSLQTQLNTYLGSNAVSATALYVIAGGGNDVRDLGTTLNGNPAHDTPLIVSGATAYATAAAQLVGALKLGGAQNIVVWNVPDVGKTPAAGSGVGPAAAGASAIAGAFNSFLSMALASSGVTIFDSYSLIGGIVANPAALGFTNVTQACGFFGNGCDASSALFWDGIHPTAFTHQYIANQMLAAVPEPSTYLLFAVGLAGLLAWRRRTA